MLNNWRKRTQWIKKQLSFLLINCNYFPMYNVSFFFFPPGNYFLHDDTTIVVSRDHIFRAGEHQQYYPVWTFNTMSNYRIRFHFTEYDCSRYGSSCWVKIGNGVVSGENQTLLHYGRSVPTNDTLSASNNAWLQARASLIFQNLTRHNIAKFIQRFAILIGG